MSHAASTWAWSQDLTNPRHKLLLLKLADSANDDGVCWPSLRTLAKDTGLSKSALSRIARTLESSGLVRIQDTLRRDGSRGPSVYHLPLPGRAKPEREVGVPPRWDTGVPPKPQQVSHPSGTGVSHPERDRTVREPSRNQQEQAPLPPTAELVEGRKWSVPSSRPGKGPFVADLDAAACTCENRAATPCRHLRAAAKAEEAAVKRRNHARRSLLWDALVAIYGAPPTRAKDARGGIVTDLAELLEAEHVPEDRWQQEVTSRHRALSRDWGGGKVTEHALVKSFFLAGKLLRGEAQQDELPEAFAAYKDAF